MDFTFGLQDRGHVKSATPRLSFTWLYAVHFVGLPSGEARSPSTSGLTTTTLPNVWHLRKTYAE